MMINRSVDISGYTQDEIKERLVILGELIIAEIKRYIRRLGLVQSGAYLQQWTARIEDNRLVIENANEYALFLEYGTYEFGRMFGVDSYPESPLKKKDLPAELVKSLPRGMAPFAPVRRVMYNDAIMNRLIKQVF